MLKKTIHHCRRSGSRICSTHRSGMGSAIDNGNEGGLV